MSLIAAFVLASTVASPAMQRQVEPETGSRIGVPRRARIPEGSSKDKDSQGRIVMAEFARCVVDRNAARLEEALAKSYDGSFAESARMLVTDDCLDSGQIRFIPLVMRGPIYAELYRRRARVEGKGAEWRPRLAKIDLAMAAEGNEQKQYLGLMAFADCVVKQDRAAAHAVVVAPTASARQDAALAVIIPGLGGCLDTGAQFRIGKNILEGALAEVLYRDVEPPVVAPKPQSQDIGR